MTPEKYFLKYAYPCSFVLVDLGKITEEKRKELEQKLLKNEPVSRAELENIFKAAFKRLKEIAKQMKKDYWDLEVIKEYFFEEKHNDFIDKQDGMYAEVSPTIRELCKVHKAEVTEKRDNVLTVKYEGIARNVFATLVPDAKVGDKVTVHWAFAIERVEE
ncbi:HypC/HybG/HupF family hydrogenase formation chaperone [Candidatus Woesearchaeota archaeon]|nr:HypC/HybG/HupF family hydrogenase formation chaperone [Candidatus Woesearchaeota archaeon]